MGGVSNAWSGHARQDSRTPVAVPYVLAGFLAAATCQTWFHRGRFIATGDIAPLLDTGVGHGSTALWGHWLGGAGGPSYQISGLLPALLSSAVERAGGSDVLAQRVLYTLLFAGASVGVAYFAAGFTRRPVAVFVAGAVGAFNPFLMTNVPNPITLLVLAIIAVLGGVVVRVAKGEAASPIGFAAVTLGCSFVVQNPPFLLLCAAWVVGVALLGSALVGPGGTGKALRFLLRASPWVLVANLWWLVPALITLGGGTEDLAAVTDVRDWAWTHARSSPLNVLRLNAGWGWAHDEYFPYASSVDQPVLMAIGIVVPLACLAAPLLARGRARRASAALGVVVLGMVVLGTGLHSPFAPVNLWLYDHLPGYWMFREPAGKLGAPIVAVYGVLLAITTDAVLDRWRTRRSRQLAVLAVTATMAALAVSSYPIWTGLVIPDERRGLPSAHVAVPNEWREAATSVNAAPRAGKVLVLPLGDFYQMPTTWGFYGADVIAESLVRRPTITRLPGGYFNPSSGFGQLVDATENALLLGDAEVVPRLLQSLGVSHVMLRHDFDRRSPGRRIADPDRLARGLQAVPGLRQVRPSPLVSVYEVDGPDSGMVHTYGTAAEARGLPAASLVAAASPDSALVGQKERSGGAGSWAWGGRTSPSMLRLSTSGVFRTVVSPTSTALYVVTSDGAAASGGQLSVVPIGRMSLGDSELRVPGDTVVPLPERATAARIGDELIPLSANERVVPAMGMTPVVFLGSSGPPSPVSSFGEVGDCNAVDARAPAAIGLSARPIANEPTGIELRAREHSACVSAELGPHARGAAYRLRFDYRGVTGSTPRACVWLSGTDRCATMPALSPASNWQSFEALVEPDPGTVDLTIFFYADAAESGETVTQYRTPTLERLAPLDSPVTLDLGSTTTDLTLASGTHELTFRRSAAVPRLGSFSEVGDCNAVDAMGAAAAGLVAAPLHGQPQPAVTLRARHHSACVAAPIDGFLGPEPYQLSFEHRTRSGQAARICLWQEGPNQCAAVKPLERATSWRGYEATVTPQVGTTGLKLFLYADGFGGIETVSEYRSVRVAPASSFSVVVSPQRRARVAPTVTVETQTAERYRLQLHGGSGPFTLVLADTFHPGWRIKGLPEGMTAEHVRVDGYANGWRVDRGFTGSMVIEFEPGNLASWARRASAASGLAALVLFVVRRARRGNEGAKVAARRAPGRDFVEESVPRQWAITGGITLMGGAAIAIALRRPTDADRLVILAMGLLAAGYSCQMLSGFRQTPRTGKSRTAGGASAAGDGSPVNSSGRLRRRSRRGRRRHRVMLSIYGARRVADR